MADADAKSTFDLDLDQFEAALAALFGHLDELEKKFANAGPGIKQHLQGIDAAAQQAAASLGQTAASGQNMASVGGVMHGVAGGTLHLVHALGELSHFAFLIPSQWKIAGHSVREGFAHFAVLDSTIQAVTGHLGPLGAALGYVSARTIGASRAMAGFGATAALAVSGVVASGRLLVNLVRGFTGVLVSSIGAIGTAINVALPEFLPLVIIVGALSAVFLAFKKALTTSADFEKTTTSFRSLVGNAELAKKTIADLIAFSDKTPFDKFQITEAGRKLVAFGFDAANLLPILTDVGDLAAGMNKPLDQVADTFGRLKAGQFGEAFQALRGLGVTRKELEGQGLKFDKSGQYTGTVEQAMEAVRTVVKTRFGGAMEDLSKTWSGLWSTLVSHVGNVLRGFGEPILEELKPFLRALIGTTEGMVPAAKAFGQIIAGVLAGIRHTMNDLIRFYNEMRQRIPGGSRLQKLSEIPEPDKGSGRADRKGGAADEEEKTGKSEVKVGKQRELGGGGAFHLGLTGSTDPLLSETQRQTRAIESGFERVARAIAEGRPLSTSLNPVPVAL